MELSGWPDEFEALRFGHSSFAGENRPVLSVGIAAYNEAANIGKLLERLQGEIGWDAEILVVASGCTDNTAEVVSRFADYDHRVKLIAEPARNGKATAINRILSSFKGELLLLISADTLPEQGTIKTMVSAMQLDRTVGVVSSHPTPVNSKHGLTGYIAHLYWRLHHRTLTMMDAKGRNTQGGEAILVRRGIVSALPRDCINDDAYIGVEAVRKGLRVRYCPQAHVKTRAPATMTELVNQRRRIISGHIKVREHTGQFSKVLTTLAFQDPKTFTRIMISEVESRPRSIPRLLAAIYIESISALLALVDVSLHHNHTVWKTAVTTKNLEL